MAATVKNLLTVSINNLFSVKYAETEFAAARKALLPGYNSSDQRLKYHDDLVHIKNGPFDVDIVTSLVEQVIEQCDILFKKANLEPAKRRFILNLAFKTNRETENRELLGYGSILLEDRRISKLLIGFDLDGEIRADIVNENDKVELNMDDFKNMTWADIYDEELEMENNYKVTLSDPLVSFNGCKLESQKAKDAYYRITLDTAKHDGTYHDGMENEIIVPEKYQITIMPFRVKDVDPEYDSDKLICPEFPGNGSISNLRKNVLPFASTPNKSHIVTVNQSGRISMRGDNTTQHRLYPYINNIDNKNKTTKTVVIYFDPSTQDAQKALNFIRTYFVTNTDNTTSKVYFKYRRKNDNPFEFGMNEPKPGSGIISDKDDDKMQANYKLKKEKHGSRRYHNHRGPHSSSDKFRAKPYNVKRDRYGQSSIVFNKKPDEASYNSKPKEKQSVYKPPHLKNQSSGWHGTKQRHKKPTKTHANIFETLETS